MTESLHLAVAAAADAIGTRPTSDVVLTCDPAETSVEEMAELLGLSRGPLIIDGQRYDGSRTVAETTIDDGSVVESPATVANPDVAGTRELLITLTTIAGVFSGRTQSLCAGTYGRTPGDPVWMPVSGTRAETILTVTFSRPRPSLQPIDAQNGDTAGAITMTVNTGTRPVAVEGDVLTATTHFTISDTATVLNFGAERLAVTTFTAPEVRQRSAEAALHRVPRITYSAPVHARHAPKILKQPGNKPSLAWITMLAPIPMALVMALAIGQRALIFGLMSPLWVIAKLWENRRTHAKMSAEYERGVSAARIEFYEQIVTARTADTNYERELNPGLAELVERGLTTDPRLWERRPGHADFGTCTVGVADRPWRYLPATSTGQTVSIGPELADIADGFSYLPSVPVAIDLQAGSLGIVGNRSSAMAAARGVVVALTTLSGPADVPVALISAESALDEWDWAKWLPHLGRPKRLGSSAAQIEAIVAKQAVKFDERAGQVQSPHPLTILIIDGVQQIRQPDSPLRRGLLERNGITGIVIAETEDELPAGCNWILSIGVDGMAALTDTTSGTTIAHITPIGMDPLTASAAARSMARLVDPDTRTGAIELPTNVPLSWLVGPGEADSVLERWLHCGPDPAPIATIGVGPSGPIRIDLVGDGPHALLAGTTGAGKSELLRSLVVSMASCLSPEQINFVLIDYKGGGAFDVCADLPHTVAMVTDLDGHLGARALRSLQAELRFRETAFREVGAKDLGSFRAGGRVMPRLVVVVDEFATLAAELPDFLDALVDVAQRGRSLGIHMVLATQRPAGVVDAKIKSNTNLRICLRVQDDHDSIDVIGMNWAAHLGRAELGRGFIRMGASEILPFQAAYTGGVTPAVTLRADLAIEPFRLRPPRIDSDGPDVSGLPSDIERMVDEINLANDKADLPASRRPWLPELPSTLGLSELREKELHGGGRFIEGHSPGTVTIGLLDVPAEQRREPLQVNVAGGNTVVYGADHATTSATLGVLALQLLASCTPDDLHLYLLDSASAGLGELRNASHVGAYVPHDDDELLGRVLDLLEGLMSERKALRAAGAELYELPLTVVLIDGFGSLLERLSDDANHATLTRIASLLRTGPNLAISLIGTANHERQVPGRLASQIGTKLVHKLNDPSALVSFGFRQKDVPTLSGSMILEVATGLDGVTATASADETAAIATAATPATKRPPRQLRILRSLITSADLDAQPTLTERTLTLPLGLRIRDLESVSLEIDDRAVILGRSGTGRTGALMQLTRQAAVVLPEGSVAVVAAGHSPLGGIRTVRRFEPDRPLDEHEWSSLNDCALLVIDDAERVHDELGTQLKAHAERAGPARWLLASMRPCDPKGMTAWTSIFRGATTGVLLKPQAADGDSLRVMLTNQMVEGLRIGQGLLVADGQITPAQLAL